MIDQNLTIIGCGNMGQAFLQGLLRSRMIATQKITITDHKQKQLSSVAKKYAVTTTTNNLEAIECAQIIILAVKPQQLADLLHAIRSTLHPYALLISIAAGFTTGSIYQALENNKQPLVRVMPNLAAKVGTSISAWYPTPAVTSRQQKTTQEILRSVGSEIKLKQEKKLDTVTAISGSGPAYYFYFVEKIISSAFKLDLNKKEASKLAQQTLLGAAKLLKQDRRTPEQLRRAVTSKGGTTQAALSVFKDRKLEKIIHEALSAAKNRSEELKQ